MERHADPVDRAADTFSAIDAQQIADIRREASAIDISNPSGECWHCGAETDHQRRWCDAQCRDYWEQRHDE